MRKPQPLVSTEPIDIDFRALAVASHLMAINCRESSSRHIAAANTSALFNLVMQSSIKNDVVADSVGSALVASVSAAMPFIEGSVNHADCIVNSNAKLACTQSQPTFDSEAMPSKTDCTAADGATVECPRYAFSLYEPLELDTGED